MTPSIDSESSPELATAIQFDASASAGRLVREARLKAGVELAYLSVTLKVPVRQLEALEADELDPGKGPVFYRGLASSVCRHLQTDAAPILALLPQTTAQLQPLRSSIQDASPDVSLGIDKLPWGRMVSSKVVWGSAFMLLLTGALLWLPSPTQWAWLDEAKSWMADLVVSEQVNELISASPTPLQSEVSPSSEDSPAQGSSMSGPSDSQTPAAAEASVVATPAAALTPPVQPASSAKPAPGTTAALAVGSDTSPEWVFSATGDSWLEVRNAQKAVVWSGVVKAGESTRIQSPLPVSVVVGRAQVVTVTLRGQPFDLKPHTQVTVARFEVKE